MSSIRGKKTATLTTSRKSTGFAVYADGNNVCGVGLNVGTRLGYRKVAVFDTHWDAVLHSMRLNETQENFEYWERQL